MLTSLSFSCFCLLSILVNLSNPFSYQNPVFSSNFDSPLIPTVIHDLESHDYLLTLANSGIHNFSFQLFHSSSLIDWIHLGWAVTEVPGHWNLDSDSLNGARMWRTWYNRISVMIMVFSAVHQGRHCIGYGFTKRDYLTSFIISDIPLYCSEQNSKLFPALYQDQDHDHDPGLYLLWSEQNETVSEIFICSLMLQRGHLHVTPNSQKFLVKSTNKTLSAPYIFLHDTYYYLFYTSNLGPDTTIQVARSKSKTNLFQQQSETIIRSNPSASSDSWHSPSYSSLVRTPNGEFIMIYRGSKSTPSPGVDEEHTFLLLDQLVYTDSQWFRMATVCGMKPGDSYPSSCRHSIPER